MKQIYIYNIPIILGIKFNIYSNNNSNNIYLSIDNKLNKIDNNVIYNFISYTRVYIIGLWVDDVYLNDKLLNPLLLMAQVAPVAPMRQVAPRVAPRMPKAPKEHKQKEEKPTFEKTKAEAQAQQKAAKIEQIRKQEEIKAQQKAALEAARIEQIRKQEEAKAEQMRIKMEQKAALEEAKAEQIRKQEEARAEQMRIKMEQMRKQEEARVEQIRKQEEARAEQKAALEAAKAEQKAALEAAKAEQMRKQEEARAEQMRKQEAAKAEQMRIKAEQMRKQEEAKAEQMRIKAEQMRKQEAAKAEQMRIKAEQKAKLETKPLCKNSTPTNYKKKIKLLNTLKEINSPAINLIKLLESDNILISKCYISFCLRKFIYKFCKEYELELIDNNKIDEKIFMFGIYTKDDYIFLKQNLNKIILIWGGSDCNYIKTNKQMLNIIKNPELSHIAISKNIYNKLIDYDIINLNIKEIRFRLLDYAKYNDITYNLSQNVYIYTSLDKTRSKEIYGSDFYNEAIDILHNINFKIAYGQYSPDEIINIYKECCIGIRLTFFDGNANTVQELGLLGLNCIHNGEFPNSLKWNNTQDIVSHIQNEINYINTHTKEEVLLKRHNIRNQMIEYLENNNDYTWLILPNGN
jgi:hypothetical protein